MTLSRCLCLLLLCAAAVQIQAQAQSTACFKLEVSGLKPDVGTLNVAAYANAADYMKKPVWQQQLPVKAASMSVELCGLDAAEMAFAGFQDLNGNQKLDSNMLGIPTEPYGASGKPPQFSAPTWDTTKVAWPPANGSVTMKF